MTGVGTSGIDPGRIGTTGADILVIGGGIAGLSAAWRLAGHGRVILLERESVTGYHSSGRSATYYHFGIGNLRVRMLTRASGSFFADPPPGFTDVPLATPAPALMVVREGQDALFEQNLLEMAAITGTAHEIGHAEMRARVPVLRLGGEGITRGLLDPAAARLDGHALMTAYLRGLRARGGQLVTGAEVLAIERVGNAWQVGTAQGKYAAPVLVNAAGAWADEIAVRAGVAPLGLAPLRRTIIAFDPPPGVDVRGWPFVRSLANEFYFLPETGHLLASPADETPSLPCDAQPDEYEIALAAWRIEEVTTMTVRQVLHKWAGLRTFAADRVPVAGFAADAPGFFWLAGQGGYGLQTAPAMAAATEALVAGVPWPENLSLDARALSPQRLTATETRD
ncbi:NAD(P)/FAD-dependent oxidoreductase [Roseateles toxinivorans]|uniref:D-arginine dehydrogenase n=1 Tax=Roseateles toxinivorans TaxID=270368 RepID=A0A4R6QDA3_9BURK|nr:FAD-binding oxidoreductase [Roseateles toxinivorans]TDP60431.1 D-arginine dehydrogenase [Roseateles toxinivorans]